MSDKAREQLSALIDGEIDEQELPLLLARLGKQAAERERFERYATVSAAIRGELSTDQRLDIAARVMADIEADSSLSGAQGQGGMKRHLGWLKPIAGLAVAASVAAVTVVALSPSGEVAEQPAFVASNVAPALPRSGIVNVAHTARNPRLDRYLMTHNERAVITGMQGVLPYVRIVGFGAEAERPAQEQHR